MPLDNESNTSDTEWNDEVMEPYVTADRHEETANTGTILAEKLLGRYVPNALNNIA